MLPSIRPWRAPAWFTHACDAAASVVFPAPCRLCENLLTRATRLPICDDCLKSVRPLGSLICQKCGSPLPLTQSGPSDAANPSPSRPDNLPLPCTECRFRDFAFTRARSFALYDKRLVQAILLLKFERIEPLAAWFARQVFQLLQKEPDDHAADVVVPVPLHRDRQRQRGYNQAALIARPLAGALRLPCRAVLLMRTKPRPNKHILSSAERWDSVCGAFATRPGSQVDNLRVLLVDDVMTTGATLDACARALLDSGAKSVFGLTVARASQLLPASFQDSQPRLAR